MKDDVKRDSFVYDRSRGRHCMCMCLLSDASFSVAFFMKNDTVLNIDTYKCNFISRNIKPKKSHHKNFIS